ncbi:MAG: hypothetical protein JWO86_3654 [Myxococcaceae bacterium]|nr:hypothetical protein [Myxococcaceae bacterium]MEA2747098.1 hypothetical protein [Myxococcales bacterium]
MCRARARIARVVVLTPALVAAAVLSACSLDWSVRPDPGDASIAAEAGGVDVTDALAPVDAADGSVPTDAPLSPEAAACQALGDDVTLKRKKARECQIGTAGQCTTTVKDECGCDVIVTSAGSTKTSDFTSAVMTFLSECEKPPCTAACPQNGVPASWACLVVAGDTRCTP